MSGGCTVEKHSLVHRNRYATKSNRSAFPEGASVILADQMKRNLKFNKKIISQLYFQNPNQQREPWKLWEGKEQGQLLSVATLSARKYCSSDRIHFYGCEYSVAYMEWRGGVGSTEQQGDPDPRTELQRTVTYRDTRSASCFCTYVYNSILLHSTQVPWFTIKLKLCLVCHCL